MVMKISDVMSSAIPAQLTAWDNETVWDGYTCDWVPRHVLAARERAKSEAKRRETFRATGFALTDEVFDALLNDALGDTQAIRELKSWGEQRCKPWVALSGPTGCGKSVAVAAMLWSKGGRFVRADEAV